MPLYRSHFDDESIASFDPKSEAQAMRKMLGTPYPRTPMRQGTVVETAPPKPEKLRRDKADDIVECAMRLMDLAMDQNRLIKRLETVIEDNYQTPEKSYRKYMKVDD